MVPRYFLYGSAGMPATNFISVTGQDSTGQDRSKQVKTGHDWLGRHDLSGQGRTGLDR